MKSNLVNPQQLQERTMLEVCPPETKQNNSTPKENYFRISKPQIVGEKKTVFYHSKCYDDLALIPKNKI